MAALTAHADADPPQITLQPVSQSVTSGSTVVLSISAAGTPPLSYQWLDNGTNVPNAISNNLTLKSVTILSGGSYQVVVSNPFGNATSEVARISIDENLTFRVLALRTNGFVAFEVGSITGDDRGGMAISSNSVFLTGDSATGRWRKQDLTSGARAPQQYNALTSDLQTEKAYSLANGNALLNGPGPVTALIEINDSGTLTASRIDLSQTISLSFNEPVGIFAGYGRVVLHDSGHAYNIAMPSGLVTDLGPVTIPYHNYSENWAFWGVAEYFHGQISLVYGRDYTSIGRTRIGDSFTSTLASFSLGISDLASFTFSPSLSRWFFHYEGGAFLAPAMRPLAQPKLCSPRTTHFPRLSPTRRAGGCTPAHRQH